MKKSNKKPSLISNIIAFLVFCAVLTPLIKFLSVLVVIVIAIAIGYIIFKIATKDKLPSYDGGNDLPHKPQEVISSDIKISTNYNEQQGIPFYSESQSFKLQEINLNEISAEDSQYTEQQNIYSTTIFLWFTDKCHTYNEALNKDFYPHYLIYSYGISDPVSFYKKLFEQGYYAPAKAEKILKTYTVSDLKIILESLGEKKTGKKEQLIKRILETAPAETLYNLSSVDTLYSLSPKGQEFIGLHMDYIYLHQKRNIWNISLSEYENAKKTIRSQSIYL